MPKVRKKFVSSKRNAVESSAESKALTRRSLLKNTAGAIVGAAAAGLAGAIGARPQVQDSTRTTRHPEFPLPDGLANGSVTICAPGQSTGLQTIDGVLVDTGSTGCECWRARCRFRCGSRPPRTAASIVECAQFLAASHGVRSRQRT